MPDSYPVQWADPWGEKVGADISQAAQMFMQARDKERARRLAADQEAYKRQEDEKDRQRQAVQDDLAQKRQQAADQWQADRHKLDVQAAKQKEAEFKLDMRTRQQKEALAKGEEFLASNPKGAADVAAYSATPETSDNYASAPPDAAAQMPSAVAQPAVPGVEPGAPNLAEAQTLSPVAMARARAVQEKQKQAEAIALYTAKQQAELQNSETLAAAQARAAAAAAAGAGKGKTLTPSQEAVIVNRLTTQWDKAGATDRELTRQKRLMDGGMKAAKEGNMAAGSQAVLVTFQKILDPQSVVRESEYARSMEGQSLMGKMEGIMAKLEKGGAGLTVEQLQKYVDLADQFVKGAGSYKKALKGRIQKTGGRYGIPDDVLFEDEGDAATPAGSGDKVYNPKTGRVE